MAASTSNQDIPLLSVEQLATLRGLAEQFTSEQRVWASGYLAGFAHAGRTAPAAAGAPGASNPVAQTPTSSSLLVLYGTETGNARGLAKRLGEKLSARGFGARVVGMDTYKPRELKDEKNIVVISATHGEGNPPESARPFFDFLMGRKAPKLPGARFAVLGLGDSSYEFFCKAARDVDNRLEALGAGRALDIVQCDVDFEENAAPWLDWVVEAFAPHLGVSSGGVEIASVPGSALDVRTDAPSQERPIEVTLAERIKLNGRGSDKATFHLELALDDETSIHQPGDALGVLVENDPALVEEIVVELGLDENGTADALRRKYELTVLTPKFIQAYGEAGGIDALLDLQRNGDRTALRAFMENRQIADVIREYPIKGIAPDSFLQMLRKLQPRLYSIASSSDACPGEIHVTVADVAYRSPLADRSGVASGYLNRRLDEGARLQVYVQANTRFRLPDDPAVPVIMIGAGTGIAPYRAFLQHREVNGVTGPAWLFLGERRFRTDFLYQAEWQQLLKDGHLSRMDVAFSRDQAEKVYVQDRMREQGRDLFQWLEDGAHVYVCGDAKRMAPDVETALLDVIVRHGQRDEESAREYLTQLTADHRYKKDVY